MIDNETKEYNPLDNILGSDLYNKMDISAKVISIVGDTHTIVAAAKAGKFNNIDWNKVAIDDAECEKVKTMLESFGLGIDIQIIATIVQKGDANESQQ